MENQLLSDQLKIKTSVAHQELEKMLVKKMRLMQDRDDYVSLLQLFYNYFGALEGRINLYIGAPELPDYLERRKSQSLTADIRSLGGLLSEEAGEMDSPEVKNYLQALGAMYVMEGSTLGGAIISQMINKQLNLEGKGLSFFQSYGDEIVTMWDTFKATLNRNCENEADAGIVITAANDTFRQFKLVLSGDN